jgi:replicative DNA helicase
VLLNGREVFPASEILSDSDFFLEAHREVFRAMLALSAEGSPIDLITVREELRRRNKEEAAGGIAYLASLTDGLPRGTNLAHYARTVREKATARQLIGLSQEVMTRCYQGEERPAAVLERAESEIFRIAARELTAGFQSAKELAPQAYKEIEEASKHEGPVTGLDTGFADLDRMTGGFHRQNLVVVAARPGPGKTSFCLNVPAHAALRRGKRVGIFSLEMSKPEIMKRMISAIAEVDSHRIQSGCLHREGWSRVPRQRPSSLRLRSTSTTRRT